MATKKKEPEYEYEDEEVEDTSQPGSTIKMYFTGMPAELMANFKAMCAIKRSNMKKEILVLIRRALKEWANEAKNNR